MAEAVEVAIEKALLDRYTAFALSPAVEKQYPNVGGADFGAFTPPAAKPGARWLRATFLPAETAELGISFSDPNEHIGILQIDCFAYEGDGEYPPGRLAASVIQWFKRGTTLDSDGFVVQINRPPSRGRLLTDAPWVFIPVSIRYQAFAPNPA